MRFDDTRRPGLPPIGGSVYDMMALATAYRSDCRPINASSPTFADPLARFTAQMAREFGDANESEGA